MNRFYFDHPLVVGQLFDLSETVFHHWCKVLRANIAEQAILFNGLGGEYTVELVAIGKKSAHIKVLDFNPLDRTPPFQVTLGQVMSKGDRMDYVIQKASELGVHQIQLLTSQRCEMRLKYERDQKKIEHWQGVAIAACEQCGLNRIPKILAPLSIEDWLIMQPIKEIPLKIVMALSQNHLKLPQPLPQQIALLVGAEGGLTDEEMTLAQRHDFLPWTIGERVLRTETAPVVALSILNYLSH